MRRARFAVSDGDGINERASVRDALTFDLRAPDTSDDDNLASQRVAMFELAPASARRDPSRLGPCLFPASPVSIFAPLELQSARSPSRRLCARRHRLRRTLVSRKLGLSPRTVSGGLCGYIGISGACGWPTASPSIAPWMQPIPDLSHWLSAPASAPRRSYRFRHHRLRSSTPSFALPEPRRFDQSGGPRRHRLPRDHQYCLQRRWRPDRLSNARARLRLEAQARKALQFVDEFENSGRGWFWETNNLGTLSYVSQQLADDFKCNPEELLGRQFTDLLSVDSGSSDSLREERTLGFHLSARFPFSDVIVRAAAMRIFTGRFPVIRCSTSADVSLASAASALT